MLLERDDQVARLAGLREAVRAGQGRVAFLVGEAGAGKTSLVRGFIETCSGFRVLRAYCDDLAVPDALGPLYDLSREANFALDRSDGGAQLSLFSDALSMLEGDRTPTIAIIEDLHWADDATIDLVRYLGRRIEPYPVLLLLTSRNDSSSAQRRLRRVLSDLPPTSAVRIEVPPLSITAVETLSGLRGKQAQHLHTLTGGNAYFLSEILLAGSESTTARDAVLARADKLPPGERAAVNLVSIFPRRAESAILEAISPDLEPFIAATSSGLLTHDDSGFAFRHEVARRAIESELEPSERRRLNALVLDILKQDATQPIARLAHHAEQADDDAAITTYAPRAARWAAAVGAHRQAAGHLEDAVRVQPDDAGLLQELAIECHMVGRMDDAIAAERRALALHEARGDLRQQGLSLRWLSRFSYLAGRRHDADTYGTRAVTVLEPLPPGAETAMAYSNMSQLEMLTEHEQPALEWGQRAMDLAESLGRTDIVCAVLNNMGTAQRWSRLAVARDLLGKSFTLAQENEWHEDAARALTNLACAEIDGREFAAAIDTLARGIAYCSERDLDTLGLYQQGWLARTQLMLGQWDAAQVLAHDVLRSEFATPLARFQALDTIARLRVRRGDPASDEPIAELKAFLDKGKEFQRLAPFATLLAERAWLGDEDQDYAVSLLDEAIALSNSTQAAEDVAFWKHVLDRSAQDWAAEHQRYTGYGMPFEVAVADMQQGQFAAATLQFQQLGASAFVERSRSIAARSGQRGPRRSTLANPAGLTARELDILRHLASGLSNKQIALALKISPKTVDHHVSAVIAKIGGSSRGQAVAMARERALI